MRCAQGEPRQASKLPFVKRADGLRTPAARRPGRPTGSYGAITLALIAAARNNPGTVRELAARSLVAFDAAARVASVMVRRGDLYVLRAGRPAILAVPAASTSAATAGELHAVFAAMARPRETRDSDDHCTTPAP
jgi:hypothetical protein